VLRLTGLLARHARLLAGLLILAFALLLFALLLLALLLLALLLRRVLVLVVVLLVHGFLSACARRRPQLAAASKRNASLRTEVAGDNLLKQKDFYLIAGPALAAPSRVPG
jgi:hypothetical protein